MTFLYPEATPYESGLLPVGDGQQIYWEAYGNPDGVPAVYVHGGPGSGSTPSVTRYFDPSFYRIILFDQRNCGRSLPNASAMTTNLAANTTWHLVDDMERLRVHLGIEGWLLFGTSWGSTLALAYAQAHPAAVTGLILGCVTTTRRSEIDWLTRGLAHLFPAEWHRLVHALPENLRTIDVVDAYCQLLNAPDIETRLQAARNWHDWESASILHANPQGLPRRWKDPLYLLTRARIITHYFSHNAWLEDGQLLSNAWRLDGIPGTLVQGRLDLEAPLVTAWELARAWKNSELIVIENAAHSTDHHDMAAAIVESANRFREKIKK